MTGEPVGAPSTVAGRALLRSDFDTTGWGPRTVRAHVHKAIIAIEAEAAAQPGCAHHCEGGHFDADDMVMNEQHGWGLRDQGLDLDGKPLARAEAPRLTVEALAKVLPEVTHDARVPDEFMDRTEVTPDGSYFPVFSPVRFAAAILAALSAPDAPVDAP